METLKEEEEEYVQKSVGSSPSKSESETKKAELRAHFKGSFSHEAK